MKRYWLIFFLLTGSLSTLAFGDDDHDQARRLKEAGKILPLQEIVKKAQEVQSGRVIEVDFENEDGRHIYEVELLDANGEVWELLFDAETGALIKREREY